MVAKYCQEEFNHIQKLEQSQVWNTRWEKMTSFITCITWCKMFSYDVFKDYQSGSLSRQHYLFAGN